MPKIGVIRQKPKKTGFCQKWPFLTFFWPKKSQILNLLWVRLLTHASRHLGEDFRKFSAKTNDKN